MASDIDESPGRHPAAILADYELELYMMSLRRDFDPYGAEHAALLAKRNEWSRKAQDKAYAGIGKAVPRGSHS